MRSSPKYAKTLSVTLIACAAIFFFITTGHTVDSPLIISEFRLRGPNGANDEFIEIYNNADMAHTVTLEARCRPLQMPRNQFSNHFNQPQKGTNGSLIHLSLLCFFVAEG
jgi:hypothetical protein